MSKNIKIFLISLLLSASIFFLENAAVKKAEDLIYTAYLFKHTPILEANIANYSLSASSNDIQNLNPTSPSDFLASEIEDPEIKAESAISILWLKDKNKEIRLFAKNPKKKMAIASITKLMTAIVAKDIYPQDMKIRITKKAVKQEEAIGNLKIGEVLNLKDLLDIMLIESSNDAAFAIAEPIGEKGFVDLMNIEAKLLKMENTHFVNTTGLESENNNKEEFNVSTAEDLATLAKFILSEQSGIFKITTQKEKSLYLNGVFHHNLKNTNILLDSMPNIIGGKTGYTEKAGECLLLVTKENSNSYLINIVLNSPDRFKEMENLVKYAREKIKKNKFLTE